MHKSNGGLVLVQSDSPNITERLQLQKRLGCKDFRWYLTTVYPQLYIPEDRPALSGEVWHAHAHTNTGSLDLLT